MIKKGMDVKTLVNSPLMYPEIWLSYSLFSEIETPVSIAYNNDIEDLEHLDPSRIFDNEVDSKYA